ncbi:hypothetical protein L2E82_38986 [Cichorium intybus]|uniref:Uncharacterized protein n=1 Tax=Cichorium intybus TaxID=13427 RepID=A0ACB9AH88_CICIN|nr:hypothetical protein L2E82_38986 [Cichorium intybus]
MSGYSHFSCQDLFGEKEWKQGLKACKRKKWGKNEKSRELVRAPRISHLRDAGLRRWNTFKCRRNGKGSVRAPRISLLRGAAAGNLQKVTRSFEHSLAWLECVQSLFSIASD